jgi:phenol hydroxylase P0 protein
MNNTATFNPDNKFVRIIQVHPNGLVEFEFAVGEAELFVELLMAQTAFDEFCAMHKVTPTLGHLVQAQSSDTQEWDWSLRAAREQHLRHDK